jgi:hypothetical protein
MDQQEPDVDQAAQQVEGSHEGPVPGIVGKKPQNAREASSSEYTTGYDQEALRTGGELDAQNQADDPDDAQGDGKGLNVRGWQPVEFADSQGGNNHH